MLESKAYSISDDATDWMTNIQNDEFNKWQKELYLKYYGEENYDVTTMQFKENFNYEYCKQQYEKYLIDKKNYKIPSYYPNMFRPYIENINIIIK